MHIDLSDLAIDLLKQISKDSDGMLLRTQTFGGTGFNTNEMDLNTDHTPRSTAELESALDEICQKNLVSTNQAAETYTLTKLGLDYLDQLTN